MVAINLVVQYLFLWFFGHDEAIGAVISSIRLSCHEIGAFLFKGYWYNLIRDLSFQVGTCDGTSKSKVKNNYDASGNPIQNNSDN